MANKNSNLRTESRERANARKRAKRAIIRLEKIAENQYGELRKKTMQHVRDLREAIKNSYADKKTKKYSQTFNEFEASVRRGTNYRDELAKRLRRQLNLENRRKNKQIQKLFKEAAYTEGQKQVGENKTVRQVFIRRLQEYVYKETKVLWQGGDKDRRNENIIKGLTGVKYPIRFNDNNEPTEWKYIENMQDVIEFLKWQNPKKFNANVGLLDFDDINTLDDIDFNINFEDEEGSPEPLSRSELRALGAIG